MTLQEWQEFRRRQADQYARFVAWLEDDVIAHADYAHFSSAQHVKKQAKVVLRELRKLSVS